MKTRVNLSCLTFLVLILMISSCKKEDIYYHDLEIDSYQEELPVIMSFRNANDYMTTRKMIVEMSNSERKKYEEARGYKSFGRICDELYDNIDPEEFKSQEEIITYAELNSKYFQIIKEENGDLRFEKVLYDDPNRYLIDENMIFISEKVAHKVYSNFTVSSNITNFAILNLCDEKDIINYKDNPEFHFTEALGKQVIIELETKDYPPPPYMYCGASFSDEAVDDRDKTTLTLKWNWIWDAYWFYETQMQIVPWKKTLGTWFHCYRTLSWDARWASDYKADGFDWERRQHAFNGSVYSNVANIVQSEFYTNVNANNEYHFGGYDGWGRSPSAPPIYFNCRPDVLQ